MMFRETEIVKKDGMVGAEDYSALTKHALRYESEVLIEYKQVKVNAKSVMGVLSLGLRDGDKVMIVVKGPDEEDALDDICRFVHGGWRR